MDPHKLPSTQEDPPFGDNEVNNNIDEVHDGLTDALDRLSLATTTVLPPSPRLSPLPSDPPLSKPGHAVRPVSAIPQPPGQAGRSVSLQSGQTAQLQASTSVSGRGERRKSIVPLQKRKSAASLRSVSQPQKSPSPIPDSTRRASFTASVSPITATSPAMHPTRLAISPTPEALLPTASFVAAEHFVKELELHQTSDVETKIAVILHDDCYGHRYSQLDATKRDLERIVERPERIRACAAGISAAYVRFSSQYGDLTPHQLLASKKNIPFRVVKTDRKVKLSETAVTDVHGAQWMSELKWMGECAESRLIIDGNELARQRIPAKDGLGVSGPPLDSNDLYLCSESVNAFQSALGGVCEGVDLVFKPGPIQRAFVCIRPPGHHCSADFPSGFCWINNVHVGISHAATTHGLTHAVILDFDLHHGDGSQDITYNHNSKLLNKIQRADLARNDAKKFKEYEHASSYTKAAIGYYSLHDVNSFPCENGERDKIMGASLCLEAHNQSIWNVHLEDWDSLDTFWRLYETKYKALLVKARSFLRKRTIELLQERQQNPNSPPPNAAIFISAGFDASEWEGNGMQRHSVKVPTEFYAKFTADVVRMSQEEGLGVNGRVISVLEGGYSDRALTSGVFSHLSGLNSERGYSEEWWSQSNLEELEAVMAPVPSKGRKKAASSYLTATKSFAAKVVSPGRERITEEPNANIAVPLPEVSWAVATGELTKLIIPGGRQTMSCRPAELNRQRREQDAQNGGLELNIRGEERRQLRSRKPKESTTAPATPRSFTPSRQTRRTPKTVIGTTTLPATSHEASPSVGAARRTSSSTRAVTPRRGASPHDHPPVPQLPASAVNYPRLILSMPRDPARGRKLSGDGAGRGRVAKSSTSPKNGKKKTRDSGGSSGTSVGTPPAVEVKDKPMGSF
ncbi:hypothetical protein N7457_003413 [Penicillium paradoxum]|uniref:uncharacterized protein n=1 Tax=Penicillium paradoxum TaxID=176176 RepID=UPI002547E9A6|nr:uncharacterized protein N7457_003413 [Penicillium paradoxum]KAJ5788423.1 hypothetical protein N7457_003413 [Penicillium paradoxum]